VTQFTRNNFEKVRCISHKSRLDGTS